MGRPGDTLSIKDGIVHINGKELILSERAKPQYNYPLETAGVINDAFLKKYDITEFQMFYKVQPELWDNEEFRRYITGDEFKGGFVEYSRDSTGVTIFGNFKVDADAKHIAVNQKLDRLENRLMVNLTEEKAIQLKSDPFVKELKERYTYAASPDIFPYTKDWSVDNMGPIYIPQEGKTVELTEETLPFYEMIITEYEKNDLKVNGNEIRINGEIADSYTFKQNYYWMMGDNRHNSEDSRYWGYVPEDHIVGKPVFVWLSIDQNESWGNIGKKIRWNRMFTTVSGEGEPVSYFKYFIIALGAWFAFDYFRKRKKKATDS